jgi:hypothetical protein
MSAQGTTDAVGAQAAPGGYSVRDLLAAGAAASAICTPPEPEPAADDPDGEDEPSLVRRTGASSPSGV